MPHHSIRAVVPSYRPDASSLARLVEALAVAGATPVVLANGAPALRAAQESGLPTLAPGRNIGFGPSIRWAVEQIAAWEWLLLANDDLEIDPQKLRAVLASIGAGSAAEIVHLDEDVERPLPGPLGVFANDSLLARAVERIKPGRAHPGRGYRSFSCVLISRRAWELTGGFDPALTFTYEDADFVRRLRAAGGESRMVSGAGVVHHRSRTSSRAVADVLPIATWSSLVYLRKWWSPSGGAAPLLVAAALVIRVTLVPLGKADRSAHLIGIRRSLSAVLSGRAPSMPPYEPLTERGAAPLR